MPIYQRLKDLREDEDKSQAEIAEVIGTSQQYYGKYETGQRPIPFVFHSNTNPFKCQGGMKNGLKELLNLRNITT